MGIEYDGIQHFKPVKYFGGYKTFEDQKRRDNEKNEYCIENNITLLRIPYTETDIEHLITTHINLFNL